ncbi:MAG: carbohydrate kinase [Proteobacteria bacterium]|nr:carbohydrate kinase [Pseudomonadota bacterium]MBU1716098.1 carbohydrate kinase [Pseudomonadota bacterium]
MIVSIGEVVWDIFADRQVLGGAPVNVAYHLCSMGMDVGVITGVGSDRLGEAALDKLTELGLPLAGVQQNDLPTGRVKITVGPNHEPDFEIVAPAAWDDIRLAPALEYLDNRPFDLVFGTLAQRDERSRQTIRALWAKAGRCFYDVNLRPLFTTKELVVDSLGAADLVKLNGDELLIVGRWLNLDVQDKKKVAKELIVRYNISVVVVTEGVAGAWLMAGDEYFHDRGEPVTVADTVGAGDSFFAALLYGYINHFPWPDNLTRANRRGGYVASQPGATPSMPENI